MLWLSETIHKIHQDHAPNHTVQVVGFNEPSLFFITGDTTKTVSLKQAVQNLDTPQKYLTFVPKKEVTQFKKLLLAKEIKNPVGLYSYTHRSHLLKNNQPIEIKSFNYSKGNYQTWVPLIS
jgi:hypothetical protein